MSSGMFSILSSTPGRVILEIHGSSAHLTLKRNSTIFLNMYSKACCELYTKWKTARASLENLQFILNEHRERRNSLLAMFSDSEEVVKLLHSIEKATELLISIEIILNAHLNSMKTLTLIRQAVEGQDAATFSMVVENQTSSCPETKLLSFRYEVPFPHRPPSKVSMERRSIERSEEALLGRDHLAYKIQMYYDELVLPILVSESESEPA